MHHRTGSLLSQDLKDLGDSWRQTTTVRHHRRYAVVCGVLCIIATIGWLGTSTIASVDPDPKSPFQETTLREINHDLSGSGNSRIESTEADPAEDHLESSSPNDPQLETTESESPAATTPNVHAVAKPDIHPDYTALVADDTHAPNSWTTVEIKKGDTLSSIFQRLNLKVGDAIRLAQRPGAEKLSRLVPGRTLLVSKDLSSGSINALRYELSLTETLAIDQNADKYKVYSQSRQPEVRRRRSATTIQTSLYSAANEAGLPDQLVMQLVNIFGWDIDFARDMRKGDRFAVVFEEEYLDGKKVATGSIVAAEFVNRGEVYRAVRHIDGDGRVNYYTPDGLSMRRAFLRTPLDFSRITSHFSKRRYHPVLKTWRAHKGVDYAAPSGTPIYTTADGKIIHVGTKGGYGKTVIIRHGGTYSTLYAHLSKFKKGLRRGQFVRQGNIIGYVGMTGLATGPHLHYEFQVNNIHHDPLKFKHPKAEPIQSAYKSEFLQQAAKWSRELDRLQTEMLASNVSATP
ncbi:MAG: peptidoglycan DD-metalloendopeptidase family protein [Gammaproteobacteria bacterium]|nr:peptidoglycan DD-metalloendopeptidase family protein [Gammaproteobacteria bacterium]